MTLSLHVHIYDVARGHYTGYVHDAAQGHGVRLSKGRVGKQDGKVNSQNKILHMHSNFI